MKIWDKGFSVDDKIEKFTVGKDRILDVYLAKYEAIASKAQANMLAKVGIITEGDNSKLQKALDEIIARCEKGEFFIDENYERSEERRVGKEGRCRREGREQTKKERYASQSR